MNNGGYPVGIAAGADGNLWFTDDSTTTPAVGRIGAGAPGAVQAPPVLSGPGVAGSPESCGVSQFATWAGVSPSAGLYSFDGYQWLRDGAPIPGASASSYTPASSDVAHQLACQVTVTYPIPFFVSASAMSAAITVQPSPSPSPSPSQSPPALSALRAKPITTQGRLVDHHCLLLTHANRRHPHCTRTTALKLTYTLNVSASVSFTIQRTAPGRLVNGHCDAPTLEEPPSRPLHARERSHEHHPNGDRRREHPHAPAAHRPADLDPRNVHAVGDPRHRPPPTHHLPDPRLRWVCG